MNLHKVMSSVTMATNAALNVQHIYMGLNWLIIKV